MRDRYLFSADRKTSEYRTILEITNAHARLITPAAAARIVRWGISIGCCIVWTGVAAALWFALALLLGAVPASSLLFEIGWIVAWFLGLIAVGWIADRRTLSLLADSPSGAEELILVGARSFGTFQEVRARTMRGAEMKLVVDAGPRRFWEAIGLLEGKASVHG